MANRELSSSPAEVLCIIDLDRTLINTNFAFEGLLEAAEENGVDVVEMKQARQAVEASGGSFDVLDYLAKQDDCNLDGVKQVFLSKMSDKREQLLFEGATELFEVLDQTNMPYMIVTYGGTQWQSWKLEAASLLDKPHIITDQSEKGRWFAEDWQQPDGTFIPPFGDEELRQRFRARRIVLIDDKYKSFKGLPEGSEGIWIQQEGVELLPSQKQDDETVHPTVFTAKGLNGAIDHMRQSAILPEAA